MSERDGEVLDYRPELGTKSQFADDTNERDFRVMNHTFNLVMNRIEIQSDWVESRV